MLNEFIKVLKENGYEPIREGSNSVLIVGKKINVGEIDNLFPEYVHFGRTERCEFTFTDEEDKDNFGDLFWTPQNGLYQKMRPFTSPASMMQSRSLYTKPDRTPHNIKEYESFDDGLDPLTDWTKDLFSLTTDVYFDIAMEHADRVKDKVMKAFFQQDFKEHNPLFVERTVIHSGKYTYHYKLDGQLDVDDVEAILPKIKPEEDLGQYYNAKVWTDDFINDSNYLRFYPELGFRSTEDWEDMKKMDGFEPVEVIRARRKELRKSKKK
jgi:hypothetical protein